MKALWQPGADGISTLRRHPWRRVSGDQGPSARLPATPLRDPLVQRCRLRGFRSAGGRLLADESCVYLARDLKVSLIAPAG